MPTRTIEILSFSNTLLPTELQFTKSVSLHFYLFSTAPSRSNAGPCFPHQIAYPQFVQAAHGQMNASCNIAQLRAQHLRNKRLHDKHPTAEQCYVGDRVWLYSPVIIPQGNTKKFTSFWKGLYTMIDKTGDVN